MLPVVVQVRDRDLNRVGVLSEEDLTDFQIFPAKNDVGTWSLKLPHLVRDESGAWVRHRLGQYLATPGAGISVALPGGRRFSGPMLTPTFEDSTSDPGGTWTYTGISDTIVLADRSAFPNPAIADAQASSASRAYDVRTGPAETLMYGYVGDNIGPTAATDRRDTRITLAANLARGGTRTKSVRFSSLLELCQELAALDNLLFDVVQVDNHLEFRVYTPTDLTDTVRMDIASDQLESTKFSFSSPAATKVIVMGQGEAEARVIRTRTNSAATAASAEWGRVIERVIDQRQTSVVAEIDAAGDELLATDGVEIQSLEVTPSDVNARALGVAWWVGDLVTVNAGGVPVKADVAKVRVSISSAGIYAGATVGDPIGFDADRVTNARIGSVEGRVSSLERNGSAVKWSSIVEKPLTFAPAPHTQAFTTLTGVIGDLQLPGRLRAANNIGAGNNPDSLIETGRYAGYSWAGSLSGFGIAVLDVQQYSPDWIVQTLTTVGPNPQTYRRARYDGTTWGAWRVEDTGWISWVPTMSNVTVGNGTLTGRYRRAGRTVEVYNRFTLGSTSAMGTSPIFALPFTAASPNNPISFQTEMLDSGSAYYIGSGLLNTTYVTMYFHQTFGPLNGQVMGAISASQPFTWAPGDSLQVRVIYETSE